MSPEKFMIIFHVIQIYCSEFSMNMNDTKFWRKKIMIKIVKILWNEF